MPRPNYRGFSNVGVVQLLHSAKGSTWEEHKYIKRIDGTYYYPDSYEGGRHLSDEQKDDRQDEPVSIEELTEGDIENLAREVIRGNFANGQERKELLGEYYSAVQKRVNELMRGSSGSTKVSDVSTNATEKVEEIAKKSSAVIPASSSSNVHTGVNLDEVLKIYKK